MDLLWIFDSKDIVEGKKIIDHRDHGEWLDFSKSSRMLSILGICLELDIENGNERYAAVLFFCRLIFEENFNLDAIGCLLHLMMSASFKTLQIPEDDEYKWSEGVNYVTDTIRDFAEASVRLTMRQSRHADLPQNYGETDYAYMQRRKLAFETEKTEYISRILEATVSAWNQDTLLCDFFQEYGDYFDEDLVQTINSQFRRWRANQTLANYLNEVQQLLPITTQRKPTLASYYFEVAQAEPRTVTTQVELEDILRRVPPELPPFELICVPDASIVNSSSVTIDTDPLISVLDELQQWHPSKLTSTYTSNLQKGVEALSEEQIIEHLPAGMLHHTVHLSDSSVYTSCLKRAFAPHGDLQQMQEYCGQWPLMSTRSILQLLCQDQRHLVPDEWKVILSQYVINLIKLQQAIRINYYTESGNSLKAQQEATEVCKSDNYDWLLYQVSGV